MPVIFAYLFIVLLWSTTPLAIHWSNSSLQFISAATLRMLLALVICLALMLVFRMPLAKRRSDWLAFLAGSIGLFPNMLLVYWSAQYISSGLMAVIMGLYPFAAGFFSLLLLKENVFTVQRIFAVVIAIVGLVVINLDKIGVGEHAVYGVLGIVGSAFIHAFSTVWLKKLGGAVSPLRQCTGSLIFAVPAFILSWWILDGEIPTDIDAHSFIGVGYLAVAGSVIGFSLFFYVLKKCSMVSVSFIPLITPVIALAVGAAFADEKISVNTIIGSGLVLLSLIIYQDLPGMAVRYLRRFVFVVKHNESAAV